VKILITGASGYVGGRIFYDLKDDFELVGTYFSNKISKDFIQLDVTKNDQVKKIIQFTKPQVVIHIANNPSQKWCKEHPEEAVKLNQDSSHYILDVANKMDVKIIYMSTMGAILPKDLYQNTKAYSEKVFQNTEAGYINLRPSVGIGVSPDKNEDNFFNNIVKCYKGEKEPIFDTSLKLQPTHLSHISNVIRQCIKNNIWNKIIPISVQVERSRFDIATEILSRFDVKTLPVDLKIPPFNSVDNIDDELTKLGLPTMEYNEAISLAINDIKNLQKISL
jgi:dTDP-4-dehydrorhamnose reductase